MHLARWTRTGSLDLTPRPAWRQCQAPGCERPSKTRNSSFCGMHNERMRYHGSTELPPRQQRPPKPPCCVDTCNDVSDTRGMCIKHYARVLRKGHAGDRIPQPYRQSHGYNVLHDKTHPMADHRGWVYEHRVVLYAQIGPGSHPCAHCGKTVTWGVNLEVDHLDWNRANNDPTNLVASCHGCNTRRTRRVIQARQKRSAA